MFEYLDCLNENQKSAVTTPLKPTLILAGAGSGKTRVVTLRINYLLSQGLAPEEIVAVTFTNKAAKEIQERVCKLSNQEIIKRRPPLICTFHSLGVYILRRSISHLGFNSNFSIYDQSDSLKLLKNCANSLNIKPNLVDSYSYGISHAKSQQIEPSELSEIEENPELIELYKLYQMRLKEANAVDFDDLLFLTVKLFQQFPQVAAEYSTTWKALLIDEYQDTNQAQYLIAKSIVQNHQNIFVVGDPDQSIYSWRGANIKNILNFEKDYPNARTIRLEKNYRSYSNILNAANALIENNSSRLKKDLLSVKGPGEKIKLFLGKNEKEEADFVAKKIEYLHKKKQIPLKDICIFYRTNFQSRTFEDALLRLRIPYEIIGGISFYQRKEIKDILAFLKMLILDKDFIAFERTINLPKRSLGPATVSLLINYARKFPGSILEACQDLLVSPEIKLEKKLTTKQKEGLQEYCSILTLLKEDLSKIELHEVLTKTILVTKYREFLKEDKDSYEDKNSNLNELISKALEWEKQNSQENQLDKFLEEIALKSSSEDIVTSKEDRLNLMTIHNSKGLEFPIAFIVGLEEDLFPHANSKGNLENIEEERRLCYVGITRAQDLLYLSATETRFLWGTFRMMEPSRFLEEIPSQYVECVTL